MSTIVEALYIFDDQSKCILEHVYRARPPTPQDLISRYSRQPAPQPSILQISDLSPPTTVYSVRYANVLLLCTSSVDVQSLAVLEFLHRIIDIFEDFLGSPLISNKIEENYEVVAQLLAEICDGGVIYNTEPNALRETVEVSSKLGKLFETVGLSGSSPALGPTSLAATLKASSSTASGPTLPWRRSNVRHTSNELYVDIVEMLSVIFAPSGRPISARCNGSIAFTAKISGVPELVLNLTAPGGTSSVKSAGISRTMQLPVFHPCVRLARWKEKPGELSFIPPDGKFMLAGYEVDLLPSSLNSDQLPSSTEKLFLPASVDLRFGLGASGTDFEARLTLNNNFPGTQTARPGAVTARSGSASTGPFSFGSASTGTSTAPVLEGVMVTISLPGDVRNVTDLRPSRGDAAFNAIKRVIEWRVPTKDGFSVNGTATLSGAIIGPHIAGIEEDVMQDEDNAAEVGKSNSIAGYYDEDTAYASTPRTNGVSSLRKQTKSEANRKLMPQSIAVSFAVKGWLPSGIKVDGLNIDTKKSRGLGDGIRPYKGVKYMTVSKRGVERRL